MTKNSMQAIKAIFIVGCPRSGTTLLQSMLAAHPDVTSFPESHFFVRLIPARPWARKLGLASRMARPRLMQFLREIGHEEMQSYLPKHSLFMSRYADAFISILNTLTARQGNRFWVEKTPRHLHCIEYIERFVRNAKFIHILRNGEDVVASLYEVTHRHPEAWSGPRSIEKCIARWCDDVRTSLSYQGRPNHLLVIYETLTATPQLVLESICSFIGLAFDRAMLENYGREAKSIILKQEAWKMEVEENIRRDNSQKFDRLFTEEQKQYIRDRVSGIDIDIVNL